MYLSVPAPYGGNRNAISAKLLSVSSRLHDKVFSLFEISYLFAWFQTHSAGGLLDFLICRLNFTCFIRQRTDFAGKRSLPLRLQRQGGAAPLTPATFEKVD